MISKKLIAAAGNAGGDNLYVEDVFSTYLYTGTGSAQTITNGIDLDGEGGLVWLKGRSGAIRHSWFDTARGVNKYLMSNTNDAETTVADQLTNFNSDGFTLGSDASTGVNGSGTTYASWTFRKAEKFFDVVTFSASGAGGTQSVNHNLGVTPAFIIIKKRTAAQTWIVYHSSVTSPNSDWWKNFAALDDASQFLNWGDNSGIASAPTDSSVTLGSYFTNPTANYVMYLFASDAGGFGDDGSENIIKCGSFTADGSGNATVDLGFEPQWLLTKYASGASSWSLSDSMRGFPVGSKRAYLAANTSAAEGVDNGQYIYPTSSGFASANGAWVGGATIIYIAIRRPMKTPESGTEVFAIDTSNSTGNAPPQFSSSFPVDMAIKVDFSESAAYRYRETRSRLVPSRLKLNTADDEAGSNPSFFAYMDGCYDNTTANTSHYAWMFKRGTGFFDVVAYIGDGVAGHTINHNLGVVPELMIVKRRELDGDWICQVPYTASPQDYMIKLNTNEEAINFDDAWSDTAPTTTNFTLGNWGYVNTNGGAYIAYLFATLAGVSKVGSYTGTAATLNVDCGFSAGARFILIKRADSTGDWYVWDSARGIVAGNDPYFVLNTDAAQVTNTDYIDPLSSGFTVTSSAPAALNASGGTYIFLAIA